MSLSYLHYCYLYFYLQTALYLSAKARSEADWIVGINASQALAVAAGRGVWSLGRVQTPTLAIICSRYLENKAFKPAAYFRLKLSTAKEGTEFTVLSTEKFDGREKAEAARAEVIGARTVRVVNVERKAAREQPPLLYDLTTLQKEMCIRDRLGILRELFGMAERIIVATDAGREGELIFRYIYSYLECRTRCV